MPVTAEILLVAVHENTHTCNPSTEGAETHKFKASLCHMHSETVSQTNK